MRAEVQEKIKDCISSGILNLANMQINDDEILQIIKDAKQHQPNLTIINLKNNELGDKGASILADALHDCYDIQQLNVEFNQINQEGIEALAILCKEHSELDLFLHGNAITDVAEMDAIMQKFS